MFKISVIALSLISATLPVFASAVVAFPGAEGFGAVTRGGAGGKVIHVTNTADSGAGSFRAALTASGARTIVFDTGGTISLASVIVVSNPYLTIACQTAPGGGIQFTGWAIRFVNTHDIIVRYCKSRSGRLVSGDDYTTDHVGFDVAGSGGATGETVAATYNVILDHCDMEFSSRDNMDIWDNVQKVTVQRSIMADGIPSSNVNYGFRAFNLGGTADPGLNACCNTTGVSIHHNLFAHNNQRNPDVRTVGAVEVINNVMYDYGQFGLQTDNALASNNNTNTSFAENLNVIGNYFQAGTNTSTGRLEVTLDTTVNASLYVSDNISPHRTSATPTTLASNWQLVGDVSPTTPSYAMVPPPTAQQASTPFAMSSFPITTQNHSASTLTVFNNVLADVGSNRNVTSTSRPHINAAQDALTTRMISETQNATGVHLLHTRLDPTSHTRRWPPARIRQTPTATAFPTMWKRRPG